MPDARQSFASTRVFGELVGASVCGGFSAGCAVPDAGAGDASFWGGGDVRCLAFSLASNASQAACVATPASTHACSKA